MDYNSPQHKRNKRYAVDIGLEDIYQAKRKQVEMEDMDRLGHTKNYTNEYNNTHH